MRIPNYFVISVTNSGRTVKTTTVPYMIISQDFTLPLALDYPKMCAIFWSVLEQETECPHPLKLKLVGCNV